MKNSEELLALAKQLQSHLLRHSASYPDLQKRMLRMSLDYLKEGWAMQCDREQQEERDAKRGLARIEALEADQLARAEEFEKQSTRGQKGCPE